MFIVERESYSKSLLFHYSISTCALQFRRKDSDAGRKRIDKRASGQRMPKPVIVMGWRGDPYSAANLKVTPLTDVPVVNFGHILYVVPDK